MTALRVLIGCECSGIVRGAYAVRADDDAGGGDGMTWVLLLITVSDHRVAEVPFRDQMTCGNALPVISSSIAAEWPDAVLQCQTTNVPLVRPRARGEG